jgi:hypothetical protein
MLFISILNSLPSAENIKDNILEIILVNISVLHASLCLNHARHSLLSEFLNCPFIDIFNLHKVLPKFATAPLLWLR